MKKTDTTINTDKISSLIMLVIVGVFASQIIGRTFTQYGILFPQVILIILTALSVGLLIKSWLSPELKETSKEENKKRIILGIVIMIIWIWTIPILGFLTASIIYFIILSLALSKQRDVPSVLFIVGAVVFITLLFWFIFHKILLVPFPRGIFI
ncbi:tripartite tricarboxylate transporter TctB family protein [Candidatus Aerophobetes bacterium]|nr:tripartite tricarboxylate transporter TctB family protein [Candidatus Aerophobetes bacterium]